MEKDNVEQLEAMPAMKAVLKNAIPAIIAMIMVLIYNLADTFFIGMTHNDLQVAAALLATPVFLVFMALGTLFGMGGTSVISRALGKGDREYARKVSSFCLWSCVGVGIIVAAVILIFVNQIVSLLGASADTFEYTKTYLIIVTLCGPFSMISNCFSNVVRAEGKSTEAMVGMLVGNLLNVVLDPIMILAFGWEIKGAAIATVVGNVVAAVIYLAYYWRGKSSLSIHIKDFTVKDKVCSQVLAIGIPSSLGTILMSVAQILVNMMMASYGDMAVAAIGVAMKVTMIISLVAIGLGQGIQPLLGYSVGSENWKRFKEIFKSSMIFAFILELVLFVICFVFTGPIVRAFLTDTTAYEYGVTFSRILLSTGIIFGLFYVIVNALQAMGAATASLIVAICRQGLIYIPALFIMKAVLGMNGLVWTQPLADVVSFILAILLFIYTFRKKSNANVTSKMKGETI